MTVRANKYTELFTNTVSAIKQKEEQRRATEKVQRERQQQKSKKLEKEVTVHTKFWGQELIQELKEFKDALDRITNGWLYLDELNKKVHDGFVIIHKFNIYKGNWLEVPYIWRFGPGLSVQLTAETNGNLFLHCHVSTEEKGYSSFELRCHREDFYEKVEWELFSRLPIFNEKPWGQLLYKLRKGCETRMKLLAEISEEKS